MKKVLILIVTLFIVSCSAVLLITAIHAWHQDHVRFTEIGDMPIKQNEFCCVSLDKTNRTYSVLSKDGSGYTVDLTPSETEVFYTAFQRIKKINE